MALRSISLFDRSKGNVSYYQSNRGKSYLFRYPCKNNSICSPYSVLFSPGIYKIECWGASGGDSSFPGGRGAYVSGDISFSKTTNLYLFLGAAGNYGVNGTYNGGGTFINRGISLPGGGATDVRLSPNEDFSGLKTRIIVAAGGGGSVKHGSKTDIPAGAGGALDGTIGGITNNTGCSYYPEFPRKQIPANQTSGGISHIKYPTTTDGSFGMGGSVLNYLGGTGGGGYYGGSAGGGLSCLVSMGGGGSSFISGKNGCNAVSNESLPNNIIHTGNSIHYSGLFFTSTTIHRGDEPSPSPTGQEPKTGNAGNGLVKITVILSSFMIKTCQQPVFPMQIAFLISFVQFVNT